MAGTKSGVVCAIAVVLQFGVLAGFAQTGSYLFSGSKTTITLNPGTYYITAYGARGGTDGDGSPVSSGLGARMEGEFSFSVQTTLTLLVGGGGGNGNPSTAIAGGGGGGSFVVSGSTPLVIAGGGGGDAFGAGGADGLTGTNGGGSGNGYSGGSGGNGGGYSGGGGFFGSGIGGGGGSFMSGGSGGSAYPGGATGYGGYGGGSGCSNEGGGGGGGYSGGAGGCCYAGYGGGGGSIIDSSAIAILAEVSGIDSPDGSPNGEIIISGTSVTATNVNSTWTVAGSPYLVTTNLVATNLTIQPGVTVLFNGPYSLTVTGLFQAVGASNNPIMFSPLSGTSWQGIDFVSASTNSMMAYCQITGATNGALRFANTPFVLNNCTISSNSGPLGGGIYTDSSLALTNCNILNNTAYTANTSSPYSARGGGIFVTNGATVTLQSCIISNNIAMALDLAYGGGIDCESGNLSLNNCVVINNFVSGGGIQANWGNLVNWTLTSALINTMWNSVASSADGSKLVAAIYNGGFYTSINSGNTWIQTSAPSEQWQTVASSSDGNKLVAAIYGPGGIYTSINSGTTWTQTSAPSEDWPSVASSADGSKLVGVARAVGIYTSTNSGATWTQTSAPNGYWTSVASSADGSKLVAAAPGGIGIYTSTNSGATWTQTSAPSQIWSSIASSTDGSKLVAVVNGGGIYSSTNSGASWLQTSASTQNWSSIASSTDGSKLVADAGGSQGIWLSTNAGVTWTHGNAPNGGWFPLAYVASSADGTKLVAAADGGGIYAAQAPILNVPTAFGGGINLNNSSSTLIAQGCSFNGNGDSGQGAGAAGCGGAISLGQGSLLNCVFSDNQATNGGALYLSGNGQVTMTNCLLAANVAMSGGALYSPSNALVSIENLTVVSNSPDGFNGCTGTIHDSVLFFNSTNQIVNGSPTVTYSDVQGGYTGTGNLNLNPQFADSTNFLLSATSPAIDAGDPGTQFYDMAFPPSLGGDRNDMGAYGGPGAALWANLTTSLPVVLVNGQPAAPFQVFNLPSTSPPVITFTNGYPGGTFEYTLDGSDPFYNSTFTTIPLMLSNSATVRVVAYSSGYGQYAVAAPVTVNVLPYCNFVAGTAGGGGVFPPVGALLSNSIVTLTATNLPGWTFLNWSGDASGTNNPLILTLNGNKNVQAVFGTPLTSAVIGGSGNGSIRTNPILAQYPYGSTVRLTAVPATGNLYFQTWGGSASGITTNPLDFLVTNSSPSFTAKFSTLPGGNYSLTLLTAGSGSVNRNPVASYYASGSVVTVTATTNTGYYFSGWSGDASGTVNPLNVTMNSSKFITANFTNIPPVPTAPPTVAITNPVAGTMFTAPVTIPVGVSASGSNATIAQVVLYGGATQLGLATNAPYNYFWTNAPVGTNTLTAVAMDSGGLVTTSAPVNVVVQTSMPQVVLTSPTNNSSYLTNTVIPVQAVASDANNAIGYVELFAQAGTNTPTFLAALTNAPGNPIYSYNWSNAPAASYALSALAFDLYGFMVTSAPVNLTVTFPPTTNPPVFLFSSANYSVNESNGAVVVTILNNGDLGGSVSYETVDGTAFGGSGFSGSYTIAQGSLTFASGQHSTNLTISILDNFITGSDIHFSVQLFSPSTGTLGSPNITTVTIHQNDIGGATNSLTTIASPSAQPSTSGALTMVLTPTNAAGQWRFPWEQGWHQSGYTESSLQAGNYPVEFQNVPNYLAYPPTVTIAVTNNGTTIVTNQYLPTYTSLTTNNTGSLTVNIPNAPSGSGWRFIGQTNWYLPNTNVSSLLPDTYFIEYEPVSGWSKPASQALQVFGGAGTVVSAYYLLPASLPSAVQTKPGDLVIVPSTIPSVANNPYGFNGQLYTDVGYGSGVAVRESVVLTAAHMVFNDATLGYVSQAYWSFQEEAGTFSPEPLAARGWYVLSGYAEQRTNDLQVGGYGIDESSPQSRDLDVAALYFLSPAARDGYGGYLASDVVPNPYLTGNAPKKLVGYPVDGSYYGQNVTPGVMYATAELNNPLTQSSNNVYQANWFLSYPGNSGGPLYVQVPVINGLYYFPAAVYLGEDNNGNAVVRAINSDVVNLINLASSEGDAGTNNSGGGVITLIAGSVSPFNPAYVQVLLSPASAVTAGAGWQLQGDGANYGNAANYTRVVTSTSATIQFKPVSGWNPPAGQAVQLTPGVLNVVYASYTVVPPTLSVDMVHGIGLTGTAGTTYLVQYRTNLTSGSWLTLSTNILGAGLNTLLPWPPTNGPAAYYRAVWTGQ